MRTRNSSTFCSNSLSEAGAPPWARDMAKILKDNGFEVAMVDSNWENITEARRTGLTGYHGSVLGEEMMYNLQLDGIGRLLAVTPNDEVNSLAALHFVDVFGSSEVYQLPPAKERKKDKREQLPEHLRGRFLFDEEADWRYMTNRFRDGAVIKKNSITKEFDFEACKAKYGTSALPVFLINESGKLTVGTVQDPLSPKPGQAIISIVNPVD